jgi:hypothetical protein
MPINMFFIVKNHWEPSFTDNLHPTRGNRAPPKFEGNKNTTAI